MILKLRHAPSARITFLCLAAHLLSMACLLAAGHFTLYVATNGNDGWSGLLAAPNQSRTDGPLASLSGARDALRAARAKPESAPGLFQVFVRGGVYPLDVPFVLEPHDSGTSNAPMSFAAYPGEKPIISGGRVLTGLRQNGRLWESSLGEVKSGKWYFRQLWVNGERRTRARSPNTGYHRIARLIPGPPIPNAKPVARDKFVFAPGDLAPWERLSDVNLVLMHSWETSIHPLKLVDRNSNIVEFAAPMKEWWSIGYWEDAQRYYVENAFELLDQPGEWYLNRITGVLSYWPMPGEKLSNTEMVAPVLPELLRFAGEPEKGRLVQHVVIKGLAFRHADWVLDPKGNSSTQAAVEVPAAITADGAVDCAVESCEVAHVGTYGIWVRRGCKNCRVQRNLLHDLGAGGIRVGEANQAQTDAAETTGTLVDNNHLFDGGRVYPAGIGIWLAQSSSNRVSHNDIHDFLYSGISVGWNWNDAPNRTHHNLIEFNHVHHLVHGVLSDAGLIYCLGVSTGSAIRNNIFHDIWPYTNPPFGWGVYLDATCGGFTVQSNLVFNTLSGGLMYNNGGHDHIIENNIFALSARHALWPYYEKRPNTFRRNIVLLTQGELFISHAENSLNDRLAAKQPLGEWNSNVYWHTRAPEQMWFFRHTFADWQALGLDDNSRIADPRFVKLDQYDFRLGTGSPARELGFQPIDFSRVGLYGEPDWANQVRHQDCRYAPLPAPPPPPLPLQLRDGFEDTAVGAHPAKAVVDGEQLGASIRVSNERAAAGRQSLKVTDSKALQPGWQPHFYYEPHILRGKVCQSFDVWLGTNAEFFAEWRDNTAYPKNVGPTVAFDGNGAVSSAGKKLGQVPTQSWVRVEIEADLGQAAPRSFKLTLTPPDGSARLLTDLPLPGTDFRELHWLGFSSTAVANTAVYLDNVSLQIQP